jgi:hypothetical protein
MRNMYSELGICHLCTNIEHTSATGKLWVLSTQHDGRMNRFFTQSPAGMQRLAAPNQCSAHSTFFCNTCSGHGSTAALIRNTLFSIRKRGYSPPIAC